MATSLPLILVCPVFHEEGTIAQTLRQVADSLEIPYTLLVVYDQPDDPTVEVARSVADPRVELLQNAYGGGALNAVKTGLAAACERAPDAAVAVIMADLADDLAALTPMYERVCAGYDVVAGSRYAPGGAQHGGPWLKSTLSRLAGRSLHHLTTLPVHDVTNSFRMYRASFLRQVEIESTGGFELSMELTVKAWAYGFRVTEVPSVWTDRADGDSKFKLAAWLPKYLRWYSEALGFHYLGRRLGSGPRTSSWTPPADPPST